MLINVDKYTKHMKTLLLSNENTTKPSNKSQNPFLALILTLNISFLTQSFAFKSMAVP